MGSRKGLRVRSKSCLGTNLFLGIIGGGSGQERLWESSHFRSEVSVERVFVYWKIV